MLRWWVITLAGVASIGAAVLLWPRSKTTTPARPTTAAAVPATVPTTRRVPIKDWDSLLVATFPDAIPRKLDAPADLTDAARLRLPYPMYLCPRGHLWLTDPAGPSAFVTLRRRGDDSFHVVRERVVFVDWQPDGSRWAAMPVVQTGSEYRLADAHDTALFSAADAPRFDEAARSGDWIVVPTAAGVSAFRTRPLQRIDRVLDGSAAVTIQSLGGDLIVYRPAIAGALRFHDGVFASLSHEDGWPGRLVYLIPLADGSARVLGIDDDGGALIAAIAGRGTVDVANVEDLIERLGDPDPLRRDDAEAALRALGNGVWPIGERMMDRVSPEARVRLSRLLADKLSPTLLGVVPVGGQVTIRARASDGTAVLSSADGWRTSDERAEDFRDDLLFRPGARPERLPAALAEMLKDGAKLQSASGELLVFHQEGVDRFTGATSKRVLGQDDLRYRSFNGIDRNGRWVLTEAASGETLIIDPMLAEGTARLPLWHITARPGWPVGRATDNWPGMVGDVVWTLRESGWNTEADAAPPPAKLWTACEVTKDALLVRTGPGRPPTRYALPEPARSAEVASAKAVLLPDGKTVLAAMNPGAIERFRLADGVAAPVASHSLPISERLPDELWLDPAGRLCAIWGSDDLIVGFPDGVIPASINALMVGRD